MNAVPSVRAPSYAGAILGVALFIESACSSERSTGTAQAPIAPVGQGFNLNASDLRFILQQIRIAEHHSANLNPLSPCAPLLGPGPNQVGSPLLPFGLRTVDGTCNNLEPGRASYGAADRVFPRMTTPSFRPAEGGTSYAQKAGTVTDSRPRVISNLIVDQTLSNPSAVAAAGVDPVFQGTTLFIQNVAPDVGLSAPFNSLFTLFGQFFDHGLDLVTKGGGTVFMPLQPDDPLFVLGSPTNFMVLTRATNRPGPDGVLGTADDVQEGLNTTTPFVDQNQTYTSHPSHQVFLREYVVDALGKPVSSGRLIDGAIARNIGNWGEVKAQAATMLGIALADQDVLNVPLLATDPYGRFLRGPNGYPQVVMPGGLVEGDPAAPISVTTAIKTGHAFLDDIAHTAVPRPGLTPDPDGVVTPPDQVPPGTYDDELLAAHFVTGDGRGNENIGLTAIHTVFHSEHNRLVANVDDLVRIDSILTPGEVTEWTTVNPASGWDYGERLFQAARFVTEMQYQHLVFEEFARKVQPMINVFAGYHSEIDPAIAAEFAHTVYRFGHSMLTETVARVNANGTGNDIGLLEAFLNPLAFNDGGVAGTLTADQAAGSIVRGMTDQAGNEIDEFITEALRNKLLGLPLDLATINLARGRSEGMPTLNAARRQFFQATANNALAPYQSWVDFGLGLRHPESLVNFIAAYGRHASITGDMATRRAAALALIANDLGFMDGPAADTGVDDVDFWVGGLAERQAPFGGLLGSTFNFVFETQLEKLQDGDRFYYLSRTAGLNMLVQLEGNSFAELVMRNTDAEGLPADAFTRADLVFNLPALGATGPILDDPATVAIESAMADLIRMPDGTVRYTGPAHVVFNGRDDAGDRVWSSEGDDTIRGNGGNDVMEGGAGNDNLVGGLGDDVMTDSFGDDVLKGGDGNDAMSSGPGFDLNQGGRGDDYIVGGSDPTETFGGPGNDLIFAGDSADTVFGDDGDDWIEGGGQADLLQGDNGAPFQNDPNQPGNDVISGGGGDDDYDAEGGDDIMLTGPGIERNEGMLGFDWVIAKNDPQPANYDMFFTGLLPPDQDAIRDRFDLVEGLSGWNLDDQLRGDNGNAATMVGNELTTEGILRIAGLGALLGGATPFTGGNIILGGVGSDVIEGRGGNDVIDGDAWLDVHLEATDVTGAALPPADSMLEYRAAVFAGTINPGAIRIVRQIVIPDLADTADDVDVAVFRGLLAEYTISPPAADGTVTVTHVVPANANLDDGIDTLRNIERLAFSNAITSIDGTIIATPANSPASSTLAIASPSPAEDQPLSLTGAFTDPDGVNSATVSYVWQMEVSPGLFSEVGSGLGFIPGDAQVGRRLRVVATFNDLAAVPNAESVTTQPTAPVTAVNDPATGVPVLTDMAPQVGRAVKALTDAIFDVEGLGQFQYQWLLDGAPIDGETGATLMPAEAHVARRLAVRVSFIDAQGFAESVTSASTAPVAPLPIVPSPGSGGGAGGAGGAVGGGGCASVGGGGLLSLAWLAATLLARRPRRRWTGGQR